MHTNTGALCCVAAGPHGAKSPLAGRDSSNGHGEPQWRTNSSFSPPPLRTWDCRLHSDGLRHGAPGVHGSSRSSNSRGSRSRLGSECFPNHHHSVSDGVLSYSDSPRDTMQEPRWTSPLQKLNIGEHDASPVEGTLTEIFQNSKPVHLWRYNFKANAESPGFDSPSSLSESSHWESTSRRPFSTRRSHMSKAVYPLMFRNPVSECENFGETDTSSIGRLTPGEDQASPFHCSNNNNSSIEHKFHRSLAELRKLEMSPDPNTSSRIDGFRWSSASSYDLGLDGERFDIAEHTDVESLRSPADPVAEQKCGVCGKHLWQKSPWSSHRIMRGSDMPTAGVLPCSHVFHAECLEQMTPKTQIHDPPCPLCLKTIEAIEEAPSVSEPLQMVLRSVRRSREVVISEAQETHGTGGVSDHQKNRLRGNWLGVVPLQDNNGSSIRNRLKRHFTFKGKVGKDIFKSKVLHRISSSSSGVPLQHQMSIQ
ncbi:hypothetical protein Tsubulata_007419 [Turnera subulata]|uniref:RING-type domain-containing protein n=1 Tax=Turnera subulata TaxID=218843 RepID=A0A9Q0J7U0_9ROSI|nr:hypothetical protein Tsubulata_007419 [Turnera subulata]